MMMVFELVTAYGGVCVQMLNPFAQGKPEGRVRMLTGRWELNLDRCEHRSVAGTCFCGVRVCGRSGGSLTIDRQSFDFPLSIL